MKKIVLILALFTFLLPGKGFSQEKEKTSYTKVTIKELSNHPREFPENAKLEVNGYWKVWLRADWGILLKEKGSRCFFLHQDPKECCPKIIFTAKNYPKKRFIRLRGSWKHIEFFNQNFRPVEWGYLKVEEVE